MKNYSIGLIILLSASAGNCWAEKGDQFLLGKLGFMSVDLHNADPLYSMGVLYGYGITSPITVEAELNLGLIGGAYAREDSAGVQIENGKFRVTTLAGYGVYRLPVTDLVYAKGKIGLLYENVKRTSNLADGGKTARGFGIAGGIGVGAKLAEAFTVELEITGIDADIIFYSAGLHYAFKGL